MGMQQSKTKFYYKKVGNRTYEERCWQCNCDFCGKEVSKLADNPGDLADVARKEGFLTVVATASTDPLKWACNSCYVAKQKAKPAGNAKKVA